MKYQAAYDLKYRANRFNIKLEISTVDGDFLLHFPDGDQISLFMESADKLEKFIHDEVKQS